MAFRTLTQCTDCGQIVEVPINHDCPKDPMKDPAKRAEHEAWEANYKRLEAAWDAWHSEHGYDDTYAYPSMDALPDEVAFEGKCILTAESDDYWGGYESDDYQSLVLESPTWGVVMEHFETAIHRCRDFHHTSLEGLTPIDTTNDVTTLKFSTGS